MELYKWMTNREPGLPSCYKNGERETWSYGSHTWLTNKGTTPPQSAGAKKSGGARPSKVTAANLRGLAVAMIAQLPAGPEVRNPNPNPNPSPNPNPKPNPNCRGGS